MFCSLQRTGYTLLLLGLFLSYFFNWCKWNFFKIFRLFTASVVLLLFSHQVMSDSFVTPWTVAHQAPLSLEFPRQEYRNGLPFPSPRDNLDPGIEPTSPELAGGFFTTGPSGKP